MKDGASKRCFPLAIEGQGSGPGSLKSPVPTQPPQRIGRNFGIPDRGVSISLAFNFLRDIR